MRLVLPFVLRKKDGTINFTAINVTLATPHAPCSSRWDLTCLQAVKLLLITQDHTPNLAIWNPSHARICPQKSKTSKPVEVCLHCLYLMYLMAEVPAMGPKPAENIVPLGIKRMMGKAQESRRDDGHQWTTVTRTWLFRLSHGPLWLQCSDREAFRCASMCCHQAMTISRLPKADHKPFWVFLSVCRRSSCMACSTTKHLKNLSAAIPPSHHRFNVHRWDTAIQLLLENSARKNPFVSQSWP